MYGCPNCGSELLYDIKLGKLKCGSCQSVFPVDSVKRKGAEQDLYEIQAFRCPSAAERSIPMTIRLPAFAATAVLLPSWSKGQSRSRYRFASFPLPWTGRTAGSDFRNL